MSDRPALRLCLALVRLASRLVPAADRKSWRMEWEAELCHRWQHGAGLTRTGEIKMVRRTFRSYGSTYFGT
jgi:hypothetical protein